MKYKLICVPVLSMLFGMTAIAQAQDEKFDLGVRGIILLGDGEPANDMVAFSVIGRYHWKENWYLGFGADFVGFD